MGLKNAQWRLETTVGFLGLLILVGFLAWVFAGAHWRDESTYPLKAVFSHVEGLDVGSDVRVGGVRVGEVTGISLDPSNWQAVADFNVDKKISLPVDSGAVITSDSLLGGKYIALTPGGDDKMLAPGALLSDTQGSVSLESLLSKFIFSVTDSLSHKCAPVNSGTDSSHGAK